MNNPVVFNNGIFFCHGFANLLTFIVNVNLFNEDGAWKDK